MGNPATSMDNPASIVEAVLDNLPVAVFAKDATDDFRFVLWNQKQERITSLKADRALGKNDFQLFSKESAEYFRKVDESVLRRGKLLEVPDEIIETKEGGEIHLRTVKLPVVDPTNGKQLVVGISEDITDRVKAEEQVYRLNKNLTKTNRELQDTQLQLIQAEKLESIGRLAAGVAHEVKNPLALLLLGVDYLSQGIDPDDENLKTILPEMREAIDRADRIVRGLVDFSSDRSLSRVELNLKSVIDQVLLLVRHEILRANVTTTVSIPDDLPNIYLDMSKFEQVIINLIINAIHAMEDSEKPHLEIRAHAETLAEAPKNQGARTIEVFRKGDAVVVLEVCDNGKGIEANDVTKLFDPFFTTKATGVGTGLGLSVVRKIVELHRGEITLSNRLLSQGAMARIIFPTKLEPAQ